MMEDIGARVRTLRKQRKMTLTVLAEQTDLSPAYISNLERNLCSPTLDNIQKICYALDIEIVKLLDDREWAEKVVRQKDRTVIFEMEGKIRYESINFGPGRMTGEYIVVEPHCEYGEEWPHSYDEIGYILEGELIIMIDDTKYTMEAGDSFYIDAGRQHNLSNPSDKRSVSLWVKQPTEEKSEVR